MLAGQPADLVFLSTGDDMNLLADGGLVEPEMEPPCRYDGIAANTVVVFALRNGNPKHIKGWADLIKPGVQVVTPNPFSSGSAKWNILAAYGAQRRLGKTDAQATAYVKKLFKHVVSQDTSGSNATNTFLSGKGDVLLTYESEAINARLQGTNLQYVIPRQTMLIQLPVAVLEEQQQERREGVQFALFMKSVQAQQLFAQYGFRPVNPKVAAEASVKKEFPHAARPLHDRRQVHRRLAQRRQGLVRPEERPHGEDRAGRRRTELWLAPPTHFVSVDAQRGGRHGPLARLCDDVPLRDRRAADRRARLVVARSGRIGLLGLDHDARGRRRAEAHAGGRRARRAHERRRSGRSSRGCLSATTSAARAIVNAVIDLPFALPTIVAGPRRARALRPPLAVGVHFAFTRAAIYLALLFVTLPFVVRTVQPVLLELDRRMEEAARSLGASESAVFARIVLPNILPGILSGVAMAFARAVGEIGAIVIISGNLPFRTEVASVYVFNQSQSGERDRRGGRRGPAARHLLRVAARDRRAPPPGRRGTNVPKRARSGSTALGYLRRRPARADRDGLLARLRRRAIGKAWTALTDAEHHPRVQDDADRSRRSPCR